MGQLTMLHSVLRSRRLSRTHSKRLGLSIDEGPVAWHTTKEHRSCGTGALVCPKVGLRGVAGCLDSVTTARATSSRSPRFTAAPMEFGSERDGHGAYKSGPHQGAEQQEGI